MLNWMPWNEPCWSPDGSGFKVFTEFAFCPNLKLRGVFTHLATADAADKTYANQPTKPLS
jgi:alanine racemase